MVEQTIFEKIIAGEIPATRLYEDEHCIAILDAFPTTKGQSLIIPKQPIDYVFDLPPELYSHCFTVAKKIAHAIDASSLAPIRTCIVVEGFEVPHAHIKLYPVYKKYLSIGSGTKAAQEDLEKIAESIRKNII
jgi:histidine triad (HIT) family protein